MKRKNQKKTQGASLFQRLSLNATLLFLLFDLLLVLVYIAGNYQDFNDKSQLLILNVMSYDSFLLLVFSFVNLVSDVMGIISREMKTSVSIVQLVLMIVCMGLGIFFLFFSNMVGIVSVGL